MSTERQDGALSRKSTRTLVAVAISLATVVITAFAGTAQAAPKQVGPATYDATWNQSSLTLTLHNASASTDNGSLTIRGRNGAELFRMPLAYRLEDRQFPIDARQAGNKVTLIPSRNNARSVQVNPADVERVRGFARHQVAAPQTRQERDDQALVRFQQQLSAGTSISSLVGTIVGAIVGGGLACLVFGIAAPVVGCLVGVAPAAAVGGLVGLVIGGGGTLIGAGIHYFNTINSPFTPPKR
ncbi:MULTISPECIES: glycine zipper family protein [Gordonia]|uniref:glycine zipper family protein n=1 Tax=Gordonia TaxID=2053 RepID=UPI0018AD119A|nr:MULTISPECIES: glycine zipper family protein [Gordonia]MDH3012414.1 glycine zipper family protein [Gordonia alkanivorans]MDH3025125.1 glycine zipper family protein [Gordonia alkanivorans]MDJ0028750.1 glycine zipper family protein [Gordonia alkanivorans]WJG15819.1 glycine zipper family protein [Gordonia sp. Swx-4]